MKITYRQITIWLVVLALLLFGIVGPRWRQDNPTVDPAIIYELNTEAEMSWEAPILEMLTWPVARVVSYQPTTKQAVVGMYSWFGLRIGHVTLNDCRYGKAGDVNPNFGCFGGSSASYLFN